MTPNSLKLVNDGCGRAAVSLVSDLEFARAMKPAELNKGSGISFASLVIEFVHGNSTIFEVAWAILVGEHVVDELL